MKLHTPTGFATGHQFLEGLRWHDGALWASDFFAGTVLTFAPDGDAAAVARVPGAPSGLGFLPDGTPWWSPRPTRRSSGSGRTAR